MVMTTRCYFLVVAIIGKAVLSLETTDSSCDRKAVLDCVSSLRNYENLTEAIFPSVTESTLKQICREYAIADKCLEPMRAKCTSYEEYYYLDLDGTFRYICDESNIAVYLKHADCLGAKNLRVSGRKCLSDFYLNLYMYFVEDKICSYIDIYLQCTWNEVKSSCGSEAAKWQYEVNRRYVAAMIKEFKCKIGSSHRSAALNAAIGILVTLAITTSIAIIIWLCRRRIAKHVAMVRARHLQHYSTQRDVGVPHQVNLPNVEHDQQTSRYVAHNSATSDDDVHHVTGIANQSYSEEVSGVANSNARDARSKEEHAAEGFI